MDRITFSDALVDTTWYLLRTLGLWLLVTFIVAAVWGLLGWISNSRHVRVYGWSRADHLDAEEERELERLARRQRSIEFNRQRFAQKEPQRELRLH